MSIVNWFLSYEMVEFCDKNTKSRYDGLFQKRTSSKSRSWLVNKGKREDELNYFHIKVVYDRARDKR